MKQKQRLTLPEYVAEVQRLDREHVARLNSQKRLFGAVGLVIDATLVEPDYKDGMSPAECWANLGDQ